MLIEMHSKCILCFIYITAALVINGCIVQNNRISPRSLRSIDILKQSVSATTISSTVADASLSTVSEHKSFLLIDGDNVRGKTRFKLSKEKLCSYIQTLASELELIKTSDICLYYDHSSVQCAYKLNDSMGIAFSGPSMSTDDVIVRDVKWLQQFGSVVVITEDRGLKKRCRNVSKDNKKLQAKRQLYRDKVRKTEAASGDDKSITISGNVGSRLHIIDSPLFADMIMELYHDSNSSSVTDNKGVADTNSDKQSVLLQKSAYMEKEVELMRVLCQVNKNLQVNKSRTKKIILERKRDGVLDALESLRNLAASYYALEAVTTSPSINSNSSSSSSTDSGNALTTTFTNQNIIQRGTELLLNEIISNRECDRVEETWERVILSENYRINLQANIVINSAATSGGTGIVNTTNERLIDKYIQYVNNESKKGALLIEGSAEERVEALL